MSRNLADLGKNQQCYRSCRSYSKHWRIPKKLLDTVSQGALSFVRRDACVKLFRALKESRKHQVLTLWGTWAFLSNVIWVKYSQWFLSNEENHSVTTEENLSQCSGMLEPELAVATTYPPPSICPPTFLPSGSPSLSRTARSSFWEEGKSSPSHKAACWILPEVCVIREFSYQWNS